MKIEETLMQVVNVGSETLNLRTTPINGEIKMTLKQGDALIFNERDANGWYKSKKNGLWASGKYLKAVSRPTQKTTQGKNGEEPKNNANRLNTNAQSNGLAQEFVNRVTNSYNNKKVANLDRSMRIFGAPYQFLPHVDMRPNPTTANNVGNDLGRFYGQTMMAEAPVVSFMPSIPKYLPDVNKEQKKHIKALFDSLEDGDKFGKQGLTGLLGDNAEVRYFTTVPAYPTYIRIVNLLCRSIAIFMGLGNVKGPDKKTPLKFYDWSGYRWKNSNFSQVKEYKGSKAVFENQKNYDIGNFITDTLSYENATVNFYVDANTSFSEGYENSTGASRFASAFSEAESGAKELGFLIGASGSETAAFLAQGVARISDNIGSYGKHDTPLRRLFRNAGDVIRGANMIFPDIWVDSSVSSSYGINMTFNAPYGDPLTIYYNNMVPCMHILAMSAPIQVTANSFRSPLLCKVFSKGWFNCEHGMITSVDFDKGADSAWTVDGYPTSVKVSIRVADLYKNFMVTSTHSPILFFRNQGLMNYLAVNGNIDLNMAQPAIIWEVAKNLLESKVRDIPADVGRQIIQSIREKVDHIAGFTIF